MSNVPLLGSLCLDSIVNDVSQQISKAYRSFLLSSTEESFGTLRAHIKSLVSSLEHRNAPPELIYAIQRSLCEKSTYLSFIFALGVENNPIFSTEVVPHLSDTQKSGILPNHFGAPRMILNHLLSTLPSTITTLKLPGVLLTDFMLSTLAASSAAKSLRVLDIRNNYLTDDSASTWSKFESIEDLNVSDVRFMSSESLKALAALPSLRSIELGVLYRCKLHVDALHFFQPGAAPQLSHFGAKSNEKDRYFPCDQVALFRDLIACLENRQNRHLIQKIDLDLVYHPEPSKLFALLPNIQYLSIAYHDWSIIEGFNPSTVSQCRYVSFLQLDRPITDSMLQQLAERFPNLQHLEIVHCEFNFADGESPFLRFTGLQKLHIQNGNKPLTLSIMRLPASLRCLKIEYCNIDLPEDDDENQDGDDDKQAAAAARREHRSKLVQNLIHDVPNLTHLELQLSLDLDTDQVQMLYDQLPELQLFNMERKNDQEDKEPAVMLRHGKIKSVSFRSSSNNMQFEKAPTVVNTHVQVKEWKYHSQQFFYSISPTSTPGLLRLYAGLSDMSRSLDTFSTQIRAFPRSVEHLAFSAFDKWDNFELGSLPKGLQSLQATSNAIIDASSLQNLTAATLCCKLLNLDSAVLPWMQSLYLHGITLNHPFVINAERLPNLETLTLKRIETPSIHIANHRNIFEVIIANIGGGPNICIENCSNLTAVTLKKIRKNTVNVSISGNSKLRILKFIETEFISTATLSISCPSLEDLWLEIDAEQWDPIRTVCDQLVETAGTNIRGYFCDMRQRLYLNYDDDDEDEDEGGEEEQPATKQEEEEQEQEEDEDEE